MRRGFHCLRADVSDKESSRFLKKAAQKLLLL
jgi:hypothetical protein